jgi:uncharacterized protein
MEEILASIRRIIADDAGQAAQATPAPEEAPAAPSEVIQSFEVAAPEAEVTREADILELTQPIEPAKAPSFTAVHGADVTFREEERRGRPEPAPKPAAPKPTPAPAAAVSARNDELLSAQSTAAVSAAFHTLSAAVLTENARTLEDLVKEMMRPMLKAWLDENLPGLVDRMVRAEIERVARGGR